MQTTIELPAKTYQKIQAMAQAKQQTVGILLAEHIQQWVATTETKTVQKTSEINKRLALVESLSRSVKVPTDMDIDSLKYDYLKEKYLND